MHILGKDIDPSTVARRGTASLVAAAAALALASCGSPSPKRPPGKAGYTTSTPNTAPKSPSPKICHGIIDLASITITQDEAARLAKLPSGDIPKKYLDTLTRNHTTQPVGVLGVFGPDATSTYKDGPEKFNNDKLATQNIATALGVATNIRGVYDEHQHVGTVEIATGQRGTFPCPPGVTDTPPATGKA